MIYFNNNFSYNAKFNLALEEILLRNSPIDDDILMLWQNSNSVIIGRNQLTRIEVDKDFADFNSIEIVRRLTGGGSVYHDLGNLNYSIIFDRKKDPKKYLNVLVSALNPLSSKPILSERNDIIIDQFKVSGVAISISQNKTLLHGTLLLNSNLEILSKVLTPDKKKFINKRIKSVKSRVNNIQEITKTYLTIPKLKELILTSFEKEFPIKKLEIKTNLIKEALKLKNNKYIKNEWNFNKKLENKIITKKFNSGLISISYHIYNNILSDVQIYGDFFYNKEIEKLQDFLNGKNLLELEKTLNKININDFILGITKEEFLELF